MAKLTIGEINDSSPLNTGGREDVPKFERKLLLQIISFASKKRFIYAVDGLRRVGKTVLLKQIGDRLQKSGKGVFYFSFDSKAHQNPMALEQVLKHFLGKDREAAVILDEIGKIEDWGGILKKYYDRTGASFFISSSAALHISKGKESLAGRMLNYTLPPLGFDEYLTMRGASEKPEKFDFSRPETTTRHSAHLEGFLSKGSYPELVGVDDAAAIKKYVRNSTVEKMVFEDIASIFPIAHPSKLQEIFDYFANYSGDFLHENTISSAIGLSVPTVGDYVAYLEQSHLVKRVYTDANYAIMIRKKKKGYVASASIYSNCSTQFSYGKAVETAVFEKLASFSPRVYFDAQKREVDFILGGKEGGIAVEVKSGDKVGASDVSGLVYYMRKKGLKDGFVVYNGPYDIIEKEGMRIHLLPLSTFLAADEIVIGKEGK